MGEESKVRVTARKPRHCVIPSKARNLNPYTIHTSFPTLWIPAYAGMTVKDATRLVTRHCGLDPQSRGEGQGEQVQNIQKTFVNCCVYSAIFGIFGIVDCVECRYMYEDGF